MILFYPLFPIQGAQNHSLIQEASSVLSYLWGAPDTSASTGISMKRLYGTQPVQLLWFNLQNYSLQILWIPFSIIIIAKLSPNGLSAQQRHRWISEQWWPSSGSSHVMGSGESLCVSNIHLESPPGNKSWNTSWPITTHHKHRFITRTHTRMQLKHVAAIQFCMKCSDQSPSGPLSRISTCYIRKWNLKLMCELSIKPL